jgi:hypothetical protein
MHCLQSNTGHGLYGNCELWNFVGRLQWTGEGVINIYEMTILQGPAVCLA